MTKKQKTNEKICIIGLGYIGLPLATLLAENGYEVVGVDINSEKISKLNKGELILDERGFSKHFSLALESSRLKFQLTPEASDVFIIAVPTPLDSKTLQADLTYVINALNSFIPYLSPKNLIILESTVPPLTCRNLIRKMVESRIGLLTSREILIAHCPERAYPGNLVHEFIYNDRVIGGLSKEAAQKAKNIYSSFVKGEFYLTDDLTAEIVKLAENTYRDINIAYANELKLICDFLKVDNHEITRLANHHPRVHILNSGIGVGGHCIPIDPWFLRELNPKISPLITIARKVNDSMPTYTCNKILELIPNINFTPKIVLVGKSYKPDVKDIRESPALEVAAKIKEKRKDINLVIIDPFVDNIPMSRISEVVTDSDLMVILVPHKDVIQYIENNMKEILSKMRTQKVVSIDNL